MRLDHLLSMETMLREDLNGDFESGTFSLVMLFGFEGSRLKQLQGPIAQLVRAHA